MTQTPHDIPLPQELPLFPLNGVLLLPRGDLPLNVFEPRYLALVDAALESGRTIGILQPAAEGASGLSARNGTNLYRTGCAGRIRAFEETEDGRYLIQLRGLCRFDIVEELEMRDGFRRARANYTPYLADLETADIAGIDRDRLISGMKGYFDARNLAANWDALAETSDERLITTLAMVCPFDSAEKQVLLESPDIAQRCKLLIGIFEAAMHDAGGNISVN